ncbi:hypothetical protein BGZ49_005206 [Haplosporangium sp. Z 27]|nr:hypothetical protein BGZ49_005206 [Haplosporangium sp. Z 27]
MPRFKLQYLLVLTLVLACLVLSFDKNTATAVSIPSEDQDDGFIKPYADLDGNLGDTLEITEEAPVVHHGSSKNVDEFSNYDDSEQDDTIPPSEQFGGIDLSTEETQSFFLSLAMIMVSEIGDKTFLIAAIMAMKHPRFLVFSAALSALAIMSVLSAAFGHAVPNLIPRTYTNYLAAILLFCFGIRMIYDGYYMTEEDAKHELEEVTQELQDKEGDLELLQRAEAGSPAANSDENADDISNLVGSSRSSTLKKSQSSGIVNLFQLLFSPVFVQTFVMTFLAEWGDRSQISTIALAAAHNMIWVSVGAVFGHSICTGVAVIGGRMLASRISVRTVTLAGAVVFEIFAVVSLYEAMYDV